jgi:RNA polymerase sigma-70 factor (ECF subfamily)
LHIVVARDDFVSSKRPGAAPTFVPRSVRSLRSPESPPARAEDPTTDAELVERALRGDKWAEAAIYRRHGRYVSNLAARLLGRREEAREVLQDVFVEAFANLEKLRSPDALRAWLLQITVFQAHRRFRKRRFVFPFRSAKEEDLSLGALASSDASPETKLLLSQLAEGLARMPERPRFAWILVRVEGEALPDVAAALGCSIATVKRAVGEAEDRIRALFGEEKSR